MARTGPPCPICGRTGVFAATSIYIPPSNHQRRIMRAMTSPHMVPGIRPADVVYDVCPLLDGDPSGPDDR